MITEATARALTLEELAERLRDHVDPAVRLLAARVIAAMDYGALQEEDEG